MLSVGIVGLPNVGKSTLFNALLKKQQALSANYPFATIEPNIGIVPVPDKRLNDLAELIKREEKMENLPPLVPALIKFVDIAGLVKGASAGEGLGNQFLAHIRECDAIVEVVRDFSDENIIRSGSVSPTEDVSTIKTELILADLQTIEKRISSLKQARLGTAQKLALKAMPIVEKIKESLNGGLAVSELNLSDDESEVIRDLSLLTQKPLIYVLNSDEDKLKDNLPSEFLGQALRINAKIEAELSELNESDQEAFLKELGLSESGLSRVIKKAYDLLGLLSYFTAGPKEVRAWTIKSGDKAPAAAGKIHSDFERGFIAAEIIGFEELLSLGSYKKAKETGKLRLEGKEYVVADGDVIEFRFSV